MLYFHIAITVTIAMLPMAIIIYMQRVDGTIT